MTPLATLRQSLEAGATTPLAVAEGCVTRANTNALRNTYLHFDKAALFAQARALSERFPHAATRPPLYCIPVSLKDCFDLADTATTCGSRFYAQRPYAAKNSAVAQRLLEAGCLVTGKTHLHQLAYGITGQNADYGDCRQPRDASLLTGGSSSGAAASVQEGSAVAAIGTDTGGSLRVPAALCGLAGYRASHGLATHDGGWPDLWSGGTHLAPSFDTLGLLCRDALDLPLLADALFGISMTGVPATCRIGCIPESFLSDAEPEILAAFRGCKYLFPQAVEFDTSFWCDSVEIFTGIQAHEAAAIHSGHFQHFEPAIAQRLTWGESIPFADLDRLRDRLTFFRAQMAQLFRHFDFLMLPCAPVCRLYGDADQTAARQAILRYTTPFSLAGLPVVALPGSRFGTGIQLAAAPGNDAALLAFAASLPVVL